MAAPSPTYRALKRVLDVAGAAVLLVLLAPLLLLLALLIVLESGRPVFFAQERIGRDGTPFRLYKLRTLKGGRHDKAKPQTQVTRVGRWLRRYGLDELPQLWNVLRGEMSLVGPRPTLPEQVRRYGPFERKRLRVRPGLTGWAQVHGRNALSWPKRIELDVWYVEHQSLATDLRILLRTPGVLASGDGTYGAGGENPDFPASSQQASSPSA